MGRKVALVEGSDQKHARRTHASTEVAPSVHISRKRPGHIRRALPLPATPTTWTSCSAPFGRNGGTSERIVTSVRINRLNPTIINEGSKAQLHRMPSNVFCGGPPLIVVAWCDGNSVPVPRCVERFLYRLYFMRDLRRPCPKESEVSSSSRSYRQMTARQG